MNGIIAIIEKEFARFFLDRRMLITTILLPGILIYVVYTLMGSVVSGLVSGDSQYAVAVKNMPQSLSPLFSTVQQLQITDADGNDDDYKAQVEDGRLALYVVFPEDFDEAIADKNDPAFQALQIEMWYNSADENSSSAYSLFVGVLDAYEESIANLFDIKDGGYDLASDASVTSYILSAVVPMVLLVLLFSGCMAVAPESIAGEKERGTLATMLVTPVKRSHIAIGKIVSLSCISLLSGVSSFLGLILSLPNLMQGAFDSFSLSMFSVGDYFMMLGVMLSTVLLLVGVISCVSALAKSVKEASSYVGPLNIIVIVVGLLSSFAGGAASPLLYLIPVYNSAMIVTDIMALSVSPLTFALTMLSNIVVAGLLVFLLTRMFNSEKIMFNK